MSPLPSPAARAVTLDVGGSHVTAARVDLSARRLDGPTARLDVPHTAPLDAHLSAWTQAALAALGDWPGPITHLGVAVPSPFDHGRGVSHMTHKFAALRGQPLRPALRAGLSGTALADVPIHFGNDADLFALGEWWAGAGRGAARLLGVTLGTGLGSGFIDRGRIVTDGPGVPPHGELWNAAFDGGLAEAAASGEGLRRLARQLLGEALGGEQLSARLARDPHDGAARVYAEYGAVLARVLAPHAAHFGAQRVVCGGNVSRAFAHFGPALQAGLPPGVRALQAEHFERAALLGAATLSAP